MVCLTGRDAQSHIVTELKMLNHLHLLLLQTTSCTSPISSSHHTQPN
uniref:Uncharacterized protein n=1 Tax=Arundo donax TaxID=35708 RepID=A0A0A9B1L0_ARUDO